MKRTLALILGLVALFAISGCDVDRKPSSDNKDRATVETQQQIYLNAQPVPLFQYSRERDTAIQLYVARNETVATWSVWRSDLGQVLGHCASLGFPIPYDTSLTNPVKPVGESYHAITSVEQAEPNGLYSSKNSIATWVLCLKPSDGETVVAPVYVEDNVTVYSWPVYVDYDNNRVVDAEGAKPTLTIKERGKTPQPARAPAPKAPGGTP
jgi:hypothetical protein